MPKSGPRLLNSIKDRKDAIDWDTIVVKTKDTLKLAGVLAESDDVILKRLNSNVKRQTCDIPLQKILLNRTKQSNIIVVQ